MRLTIRAAAVLVAGALACRTPATPTATFPTGWRFAAGEAATFAPHYMIASNNRLASEAGSEIILAGGNAVDAAAAVGFALAVTYPFAGNLGGGGYMVIRMADGRAAALDYRETAPQAATRDMYLDSNGNLTNESLVGYRASGVPGSVAGLTAAVAKYGSKTLAEVMAPAIRLARDGFVVDSALSRSLRSSQKRITSFDGGAVFFPGGEPLAPGTLLRQPALAHTLELIAEHGPRVFYEGEVGDSLAAAMQRGGGLITREDLAKYQPIWREPIRSDFHGYTLYTMPPSSSGGITITETLNILSALGPLPPWGSARYDHLLASAYQRAFIDRNSKLGDPAFVDVPQAELVDPSYAKRLAATIPAAHATPTPTDGSQIVEGTQTTHYSVVDDKGNAVSTTTTINSGYGSGVYLANVGFFMNDEMDDFAAAPGKPNVYGLVQGESNAIAPGKRMLSSMSPTIVLDPDGKLLLVVGAAGGSRIITATSQVILNVIQNGMTLADAMRAPRLHDQALPDSLMIERGGITQAVADSLTAMGYGIKYVPSNANVNAVMRVKNGWDGVSEPRSSGANGAVGR